MPKVFYRQADGVERVVDGTDGESVMKTASQHGVDGIVGQCGGVLSCASCHVFVDESDLPRFPEMDELEDEMLDCTATDREDNSRLSCQLLLVDGEDVHVSVPATQL